MIDTNIDTKGAPFMAQRLQRRGRRDPRLARLGLGMAGVGSFILILELTPRVGIVDAQYLPPFSEMVNALVGRAKTGDLWLAVAQTLRTWGVGLGVSVVAGIVMGMLIGSFAFLRRASASTIEFLRPIPSVALIPLVVLLFGTGMESTLLLVIYGSFWPVLIQVLHGVQDVDSTARDTARVYHFRFLTEGYRLVWPTVLPYAVTAFRLAASIALIITVTGELIIGTPGLGRSVSVAQSSGAVASMYGYVIVTGLLGVAVNLLVRLVERRILHWHPAIRSESFS